MALIIHHAFRAKNCIMAVLNAIHRVIAFNAKMDIIYKIKKMIVQNR